uniref:UBC core domain-containing protein n=1 Tax=Chromera velia CCMP2878 TaxID=1169474 RepID=A0A0G4GV82_9ALVE|eukprot:Cvel_5235.t1-p1 / transcript=Cvel_5235.t1 / gene=Cvel_5235 / organism=Chromera_velia_CCMP2878 / gene_product=Ubiquitin-conjugating enzyme E2 D3, putative / transcript_product=Ubiquitin-conjugating enzyme E2 D3, putative / location=Cvel_scaffold241:17674-18879(+) / protein_length=402 / sequence_SO=supercontig / SO=protein_coding / is_pseudo=false
MAVRRITKEFDDLCADPPDCVSLDLKDGDTFKWRVLILGPQGTPYEEKLLSLELQFPPDYPFKPFRITCLNDQPPDLRVAFHPSLSSDASSFPLPFLGCDNETSKWNPALTARKVLESFLLPQLRVCSSQAKFLDYFKNERFLDVFSTAAKKETDSQNEPPAEGSEAAPKLNPPLDPPHPDALPIRVKTLTGREFLMGPYPENATVYQLKKGIEAKEDIPSKHQRLVFDGVQLSDLYASLGSLGLSVQGVERPVVHLVMRLLCSCAKNIVRNGWMVRLAERDWNQFCRLAREIPGETRKAVLRILLLLGQARAELRRQPEGDAVIKDRESLPVSGRVIFGFHRKVTANESQKGSKDASMSLPVQERSAGLTLKDAESRITERGEERNFKLDSNLQKLLLSFL